MKYRFLFAAIAIAMGLLCVRLGLWQLDRRAERRAHNANVAARAIQPAQDLATLRGDTSELRYRRARITGVADYSQELILGNRSRSGAPGINFLTPVRIPGRDTAVLVNRGWVYSPDAATPPDGSWREQDTVTFEGYVDILAAGDAVPANPRRPRLVPRATYASVAARVPYPVAGIYLVALLPEEGEPAPAARMAAVRAPSPVSHHPPGEEEAHESVPPRVRNCRHHLRPGAAGRVRPGRREAVAAVRRPHGAPAGRPRPRLGYRRRQRDRRGLASRAGTDRRPDRAGPVPPRRGRGRARS